MTDPKWYAVHTKPAREKDADTYLRRQGYMTFFPFTREKKFRTVHAASGKRCLIEVERPLFSRYIFVALRRRSDNLFDVNETYGVSTVVSIGGEPLQIPDGVITRLMSLTDADGLVAPKPKEHWFKGKPGDTVEMKDEAPYYGLMAELASVADVDRKDEITIFVELLGAKREVTASATAVAKVIAA